MSDVCLVNKMLWYDKPRRATDYAQGSAPMLIEDYWILLLWAFWFIMPIVSNDSLDTRPNRNIIAAFYTVVDTTCNIHFFVKGGVLCKVKLKTMKWVYKDRRLRDSRCGSQLYIENENIVKLYHAIASPTLLWRPCKVAARRHYRHLSMRFELVSISATRR